MAKRRQGLWLGAALLLAAALPAAAGGGAGARAGTTEVSQRELLDYLAGKSELLVIDARSPAEYAAGHIHKAISLPVASAEAGADGMPPSLHQPLLLYCKTGRRAEKLRGKMLALGYTDVRVLAPAQMLWADELPVFNCGGAPKHAQEAQEANATAGD